jgi:hypothetical protein
MLGKDSAVRFRQKEPINATEVQQDAESLKAAVFHSMRLNVHVYSSF